jgi:hypothetical protein
MRRTTRTTSVLSLALLSLAVAACGQDAPRGDPLKGGAAPPAQPGMGPGGMPPGHPPMGQMPGQMPGKTPPAMREPSPAPFSFAAPPGWAASPPTSGMRMAQFDLPGKWPDGGAVQCVVFSAMLGGRQGNIDRWIGQVGQTDGSPSNAKAKITESKVGKLNITRVEIRGTYVDGMAKVKRESDDALLLGAVIDAGSDEVWTIKLAGPRSEVEPEMAKFDALLASIQAN